MVHQKNADTDFDFVTEGIYMFDDGVWVKVKGTTLIADNGISLSSVITLQVSDSIAYP